MGSNSVLFSGNTRRVVALVSPHCFSTHAQCRSGGVYHLRLPQIESRRNNGREGWPVRLEGYPHE
jgi:hypothetical protein